MVEYGNFVRELRHGKNFLFQWICSEQPLFLFGAQSLAYSSCPTATVLQMTSDPDAGAPISAFLQNIFEVAMFLPRISLSICSYTLAFQIPNNR